MQTVRPFPPDPDTPVLHDVPTPADAADHPVPAPEFLPRLAVAPTPAAAPQPDPDPDPPEESAPAVLQSARRQHPWLVVVVDDTPSAYAALLWALREAARREATVVAVSVTDGAEGDGASRHDELDALVRRATDEAGVTAQVQTAVLDAAVLAALTGAARGADLVVVGAAGKTLLRPAVARTPARRFARGA